MFKILIIALFLSLELYSSNVRSMLVEARMLYYKSTDDESKVEPAIKKFTEIARIDKSYTAVAKTYIGSLTAIKAKHAFMPNKKYSFAIDGIKQMEQGISLNPNNIESLFIYGTTCYYLPFFFAKSKDAEISLKKIIQLANINEIKEDKELVKNALLFINANLKLNAIEADMVKNLLKKYN